MKLWNLSREKEILKAGRPSLLMFSGGNILAIASVPEYSSKVLSEGGPANLINKYINDKNKPFINRAISGLYAPGSVVKPFVALAALSEGIISPEKKYLARGKFPYPIRFSPTKKLFLKTEAHGWVDMRQALAVSSDVYFYEIGGGFEDIKGLGINKIYEYGKSSDWEKRPGLICWERRKEPFPVRRLKKKIIPPIRSGEWATPTSAPSGRGYF